MANLITVGRLIVMFGVVALIYFSGDAASWFSMVLIALIFASDGIDGWVARRRNSTSAFGAVLDIAGDRIVENVLWVLFAALDAVPLWVPFMVMTRGFIVDALRSLSYADGMTAFGERNMMKSPITQWLTAGRFMRALFGYAKAGGFVFLTGYVGSRSDGAEGTALAGLYGWLPWQVLGWGAVWLAVGLTILRGIPVIVDAWGTIVASSGRSRRAAARHAPAPGPPAPRVTSTPGTSAVDDRR